DWISGEPGLDVRAAGIVGRDPQPRLPGEIEIPGDIEPAVDMAGEVRPVEIGRRRIGLAVERRRQRAAITGEGAAQINETTLAATSGVLVHTYSFEVDHDFRRWLTGIGKFTYGT